MDSHNEGARTCSTLRRQLLTVIRSSSFGSGFPAASVTERRQAKTLTSIDKLQNMSNIVSVYRTSYERSGVIFQINKLLITDIFSSLATRNESPVSSLGV